MKKKIAAAAAALVLVGLAIPAWASGNSETAIAPSAQHWRFSHRGATATLQTPYAPVVYYVPRRPRHILVLAFGYPWDEASDAKILNYARANVQAWSRFAERSGSVLVAPVLGGSNFLDFRTLSGRLVDPDTFVNAVVDGPGQRVVPDAHGKFCLHGHSAGGQFAARYVVAHPDRLQCAILSAPSTYAMPTLSERWPFGMASPDGSAQHAAPNLNSWIAASTGAPIDVIVGSRDTEPRPDAPGQQGANRFARGQAWTAGMQSLAALHHRPSHVRFIEILNVDHDEPLMAIAAQKILRQFYGRPR